mmetsp:Transcript_2436/g.6544  ORF Transcript_2436/g.6544 Transcript_2436/m.6544 type:complete len:86 (-) Transcript_2436:2106-2363(-)
MTPGKNNISFFFNQKARKWNNHFTIAREKPITAVNDGTYGKTYLLHSAMHVRYRFLWRRFRRVEPFSNRDTVSVAAIPNECCSIF